MCRKTYWYFVVRGDRERISECKGMNKRVMSVMCLATGKIVVGGVVKEVDRYVMGVRDRLMCLGC